MSAGSRIRQALDPRENRARVERGLTGAFMERRSVGIRILRWAAIPSVAALTAVAATYLRDMDRAYRRVRERGLVIPSPHGDIEYTEGGSGTPVLVIHGSGGGYDQGELVAQAVLGGRFHWITPSRFGYLRSTFREGATFDDQAHAYECLLDSLDIEKVAVVALSHGGPSALLFAALHPARVSSLTLISCGVASAATQDQAPASRRGEMLVRLFKHDWPYWAVTKLFRKQVMKLMGADDAVIAALTPEQRELVDQVIDRMNPVSPRSAGAAFDNEAAMPNQRIAAVRAPTLVFHARDDTLQLYHNAEFAAATIPRARLVSFERGGHLVLGVEQATIRDLLQKHILDHADEQASSTALANHAPTLPLTGCHYTSQPRPSSVNVTALKDSTFTTDRRGQLTPPLTVVSTVPFSPTTHP